MRGPKVARHCDGCRQPKRARWRTLYDRYLCNECCYLAPVGVPPGSPVIAGAQQTGQTITTDGWSVPKDDEPEFDLSHLTGGKS